MRKVVMSAAFVFALVLGVVAGPVPQVAAQDEPASCVGESLSTVAQEQGGQYIGGIVSTAAQELQGVGDVFALAATSGETCEDDTGQANCVAVAFGAAARDDGQATGQEISTFAQGGGVGEIVGSSASSDCS